MRLAVLLENQGHGRLRSGESGYSADRNGGQAVRLHVTLVRLRGSGQRDHSRVFLEEQPAQAVPVRAGHLTVVCRGMPGCAMSRFRGTWWPRLAMPCWFTSSATC